jgi:hypothetical protein
MAVNAETGLLGLPASTTLVADGAGAVASVALVCWWADGTRRSSVMVSARLVSPWGLLVNTVVSYLSFGLSSLSSSPHGDSDLGCCWPVLNAMIDMKVTSPHGAFATT